MLVFVVCSLSLVRVLFMLLFFNTFLFILMLQLSESLLHAVFNQAYRHESSLVRRRLLPLGHVDYPIGLAPLVVNSAVQQVQLHLDAKFWKISVL